MNQEVRKTELGSVAPAAADLSLYLFDRGLHPELFRHFADYRVTQGRYYADVWIVGLSHVVTVSCGSRSMTELIAVESDLIPTRGILSRFRFKGERDFERDGPEGWRYLVSSQIEQMEEPLYKSVHTDLVRHGARRGRFVMYEHWADGELSPFSLVEHEARDGEFHVYAYHAFPHERTLVKTQTIFEIG
jgi:hypothetical protein